MNFNEKLLKLRKEKKYSQEELADKLDVTRQSVSKWESGQTYPEMDKLIAICKIFDCSLEELTNDDIKFDEFNKENKNINKTIIESILSFINQTYNYFSHITFKEFIKCFLTMGIVLIIINFLKLPFREFEYTIGNVLNIIENDFIYNCIYSMFYFIINCAYSFISFFLFFYIFKIGFLDKKQVIKDEVVAKDDSSEEIKKDNENKKFIIRSYSNAENKILNIIGAVIIFFIKAFLAFIAVLFVITIVFLSFCLAIDVSLMFQGIFIVGVFLGLIFLIMLVALIIEFICDIILNKKHNAKRMLITLLVCLIGGGISAGILTIELASYEFIDGTPSDTILKQDTYNFTYKKGMYIDSYIHGYTSHPDDSMKDNEIRIEICNYEKLDYLYVIEDTENNALLINRNRVESIKFKDYADLIIKSLKEKKIYSYYEDYNSRFIVYANKNTLNKLSDSWNNEEFSRIKEQYRAENQKIITENQKLYEEIDSLKQDKNKLEDENRILQDKVNEYKDKISSLIE